MAKKNKVKGNNIEVDFSDVEEGGGGGRPPHLPEGDYRVKIVDIGTKPSSAGKPMLTFTYEIVGPRGAGKKIKDRIVLQPNVLWRLRNMLVAAGVSVPKKVVTLPLDKIKGKELGVTLQDGEPYEGRISSEVADYLDLDTLAGSDVPADDDDSGTADNTTKKSKKKGKKEGKKGKKKDEDETENLEELNLDEL